MKPKVVAAVAASCGAALLAGTLAVELALRARRAASAPVARVAVADFYREYEKDLAAADGKYLGKTVELTGVSGRVEKDGGGYFVGAHPGRVVMPKGRGPAVMSAEEYGERLQSAALNATYLPAVVLRIGPGRLDRFRGLEAGRTFTVRGRCAGPRKDASTFPDFFLVLEDCEPVAAQ